MIITDASIIIAFAVPAFFLLILIEYFYGLSVGKNTYRLNDTFTRYDKQISNHAQSWNAKLHFYLY